MRSASAAMQMKKQQRFEALLGGISQAPYDQQLFAHEDWLVAPTLGAIIPGWLLALPRRAVLSFRDWEASGGRSALSVLDAVTTHLGLQMDEIIWFEHGPAKPGTLVGCGLDHAHLHILVRPPFSFNTFSDSVQAMADLDWTNVPSVASFSSLKSPSSYFIAGSSDRTIRAMDVETAGSQFFRRVVAMLVGAELTWDYRESAHALNVSQTIAEFIHLENVAQRGY